MGDLATTVLAGRPHAPGTRPDRLLLLLHGYGDTEADLLSHAPRLDPDGHLVLAVARGPVPLADGAGAAWFHPTPLGPDPDTLRAALVALDRAIDRLCDAHDLPRDAAMVGGFSQGGATALALAFAEGDHRPPAAVLCLSGFLPEAPGVDHVWSAPAPPVLIQHGTRDEDVPVEFGRDAATLLATQGVPVTYQQFEMGHETTTASLAAAATWLAQVRAGDRPSQPPAG